MAAGEIAALGRARLAFTAAVIVHELVAAAWAFAVPVALVGLIVLPAPAAATAEG